MTIRNLSALADHGNQAGRELALAIIDAGLQAADPYANVSKLVRIERSATGDRLRVGGQPSMNVSGFADEDIDLATVRNIYVIGAGKAIQRQAKALEDILGDRLTAGAVTVKQGEGSYLRKIEVTEGAHPVPDAASLAGAEKIVRIAESATEDDLVFALFSSGASSLFPFPLPGIELADIQALHHLSIRVGTQRVILRVMPYFSAVAAGRITRLIHPARQVHLVTQLSRFPRWRGPLPPAGNWIHDWPPAERRLEQDVADLQRDPWYADLPLTMRERLDRLDPACEVPDRAEFAKMRLSYWQIFDPDQMLKAAERAAVSLGVRAAILGKWNLVNSAEVANILVGTAREIVEHSRPFEAPVVLISGGELTVPVGDATGVGGRNQEFVLSAALRLAENANVAGNSAEPLGDRVVVASVDSDGTDGPGLQFQSAGATEAGLGADFRCFAGGIVDGQTVARAKALGIDLADELRDHNSSPPLWRLGDGIYTGNTGTCAGDLRVVLVT